MMWVAMEAELKYQYRPHRGTLAEAMAEVVEVATRADLIEHMRKSVESWYPPEELPTIENIEIRPYGYDTRIDWHTYIVLVKGEVWGFTNGLVP